VQLSRLAWFVFVSLGFQLEAEDACVDWLEKSKLSPGPNCEISCASRGTGIGTFDCPQRV